MSTQPISETDTVPVKKGIIGKIVDFFSGSEDETEEENGETTTALNDATRQHPHIRVQNIRSSRVAIRINLQVFDDAKLAADGLKSGEQQVINLEKAAPQMATRMIDFLNGVCYALDGTVEKVGEKVYLYAPANVQVEVKTDSQTGSRRSGE